MHNPNTHMYDVHLAFSCMSLCANVLLPDHTNISTTVYTCKIMMAAYLRFAYILSQFMFWHAGGRIKKMLTWTIQAHSRRWCQNAQRAHGGWGKLFFLRDRKTGAADEHTTLLWRFLPLTMLMPITPILVYHIHLLWINDPFLVWKKNIIFLVNGHKNYLNLSI